MHQPARFPRILVVFCLFFLLAGQASARQGLTAWYPDGRPFLFFDIYDAGETSLIGETSTWTLNGQEIAFIKDGADYWAALLGPHAKNSAALVVSLHTINAENAFAGSDLTGNGNGLSMLADGIITGRVPAYDCAAFMVLGYEGMNYLGPMEVLPHNGALSHLGNTVAHELGHAMGMLSFARSTADYSATFGGELSLWERGLRDTNGNAAVPGMAVSRDNDPGVFYLPDSGGYAFFQGANVAEVLRDGHGNALILGGAKNPNNVEGVIIYGWEKRNGMWVADLSHIELRNSMMSHQSYRNYNGYMEAEVAVLQDIGYTIDRKNFFGFSIYGDGGVYDLTEGYFARNAEGTAYIPGKYNTALMGMGLHVYGGNNTVTQRGDILSAGFGSAGIRVDGQENALFIAPGARVHANGGLGTGLMVAYGKDHAIVQQGDVQALGAGGVGARFDFGSNVLSDDVDYRGSWIRTYFGRNDTLLPELEGPLITSFDVGGLLAGRAAAIYISENALVERINIMAGARIAGDILSAWNPRSPLVRYPGSPDDLMTTLTFGLAANPDGTASALADPDFSMLYSGRILGPDSLIAEVAGGRLGFLGAIDAQSFTVKNGAALDAVIGPSSLIRAGEIELEAGSTVGVRALPFSYGPTLGQSHTVLRFDGALANNAQLQPGSGAFAMGAYDYTYGNVRWGDSGRVLIDTARRYNTARGGSSAATAPMAVAVYDPASAMVLARISANFARRMSVTGAENGTRLGSLADARMGGGFSGPLNFAAPLSGMHSPLALSDAPTRSSDGDSASGVDSRRFLNGGGEMRGGATSLWITPSFGHTRQDGLIEYTISTPALTAGIDHWFSDRVFAGFALSGAWADYRSDDADVKADTLKAALYGGAVLPLELELGLFGTYGHTSHDQTRKVHGERYDKRYGGESFSVGASLGRSFTLSEDLSLRPFVSYEYLLIETDGYNEGAGLYALDFASGTNRLHRLTAGGELTWNFGNGAFAAGRVFYAGLYGDRKNTVPAVFSQDPVRNGFTSIGAALDQDTLGLGLNVGVPLGDNLRLSLGYTFAAGEKSDSHQGNVGLAYSF